LFSAIEERGGIVIGGSGGSIDGGEIDGGLVESPCDDWECSELVSLMSLPSETENFLFMFVVSTEGKNELYGSRTFWPPKTYFNICSRYPTKRKLP
jgi:hypothetical protein